MKENHPNTKGFLQSWKSPIIRGALVGLAILLVLFVLIALLMSFGILPISSASLSAGIAAAISAFFAGHKAAKAQQKNGLAIGAACGAVLCLLFTLISLAAFRSSPSVATAIRLLIFLLASGIGGIIGVGSSDKRKIV